MKKRVLLIALAVVVIGCVGCGSKKSNSKEETTTTVKSNAVTNEKVSDASDEEKMDYATSNAKNDTDKGLKSVKVDNAEAKLTEEKKLVLEYFDRDYLTVNNYEFFQRYPDVFKNSQINVWGYVTKVMPSEGDEYELLVKLMQNEESFYYRSLNTEEDWLNYAASCEGHYVVIKGKLSNVRMIEGDYVDIYGKYIDLESYNIDGTSISVPTIAVQYSYINNNSFSDSIKFDYEYIKKVAEAVFGDDITIRNPECGKDYTLENEYDNHPFYLCELDNQTNAKFTAFRLFASEGLIEDAKSDSRNFYSSDELFNESIRRSIEFSADFEHYYMFIYDTELENLTVEYYDKELKKIWKREFEQTTSAVYDYTKNNIYLIANNSLYVINTETGEDTYEPKFVGTKVAIRKMNDGILSVSSEKSDAIIKTDLEGNIVWTVNVEQPISSTSIQFVGDNIILQSYDNEYIVIDNKTGSIITDAVSYSDSQY